MYGTRANATLGAHSPSLTSLSSLLIAHSPPMPVDLHLNLDGGVVSTFAVSSSPSLMVGFQAQKVADSSHQLSVVIKIWERSGRLLHEGGHVTCTNG
jgi:hypothetical protein